MINAESVEKTHGFRVEEVEGNTTVWSCGVDSVGNTGDFRVSLTEEDHRYTLTFSKVGEFRQYSVLFNDILELPFHLENLIWR